MTIPTPSSAPPGPHAPPSTDRTDRTDRRSAGRGAGTVAAGLSIGVAAFESALALGAPWGEAAWGGQVAELGVGLRVASGVAAVVWLGVAAVALRQGGRETWAPVPDRWLRRATLGLAGYTALGTALNLASRSELERAIWSPTTLAMAVSLGLAATWGRRPGRPSPRPVSRPS